ncbi:NAD(P)-binding domain-containing protein [Nocardiopsis sp. ARC36]
MKIAVLGAGNVGALLAKAFAAAGHDVTIANSRGPETLAELAAKLGVRAAYAADAVKGAETVVTSVNPRSYASIRPILESVPEDVPVIDTGNYHPLRDGKIDAMEEGQVEALWISEQLGRPVTKAWNAVLAQTLEEAAVPAGTPGRIALPIAGDDPAAKRVAAGLVDDSGFDAVDIGGLENTWRVQPGTPAYCTELPEAALREAVDRADASQAPVLRDLAWEAFRTFGDDLNRENVVRFHRAMTRTPDPRGVVSR